MIGPTVASLVCAVAVGFLVGSERRADRRGRWRWKPLASAAFVMVPLLAGALRPDAVDSTVARWVFAGLCLGAVGDVLLMFETERTFLAGLVAFLFGHLAYAVALTQVVPMTAWLGGAMAGLAPLLALGTALVVRWLWPDLGAMRWPVIAYVLVITAMLVGGLAVSIHAQHASRDPSTRGLLTGGAVAFFLSDLAVARDKFKGRDPWNSRVGLPLYYGAQLLFAWAIVPR